MNTYSAILAKHFEKLGFDDDYFKIYESKTEDRLQNLDSMCGFLSDIRAERQQITIYTDFDVDGIMSSVIAYAGLSELGFCVNLFKPDPSAGYGFRTNDVDAILAEFPGTNIILTGDVGIACNDTIDYAKSKGLTVLVTDHHDNEVPCSADMAINPNQIGETYSHNDICGAFVMYIILARYAELYCIPAKQVDIYRLRVFAGIATISDVMPLIYENRELVRSSVSIMRYFYGYELHGDTIAPPVYSANYSRAFVGLKKLLDYFHMLKKIKKADDIDEQFYGYYLVPFLNSCKRMHGDMHGIYDIFFSEYVVPLEGFENMACVENGLKYVESLNDMRKEITTSVFEKLLAEKEAGETDNAIYMQREVYIADVGAGICGLLATKFINMTGMPTLVVVPNADGSYSGSGRNPAWMDLSGKMAENDVQIICRGHINSAFGVIIPDKVTLDKYALFFDTVVRKEAKQAVAAHIIADTSIILSNMSYVEKDFNIDADLIREFLKEKESFHPYGHAFPEPVFKLIVDRNSLEGYMFGSSNQHYKFIMQNGMEIILFYQALDIEKIMYDNMDIDYAWVFEGRYKYDDYDTEYDTICFYADNAGVTQRGNDNNEGKSKVVEGNSSACDNSVCGADNTFSFAHGNRIVC